MLLWVVGKARGSWYSTRPESYDPESTVEEPCVPRATTFPSSFSRSKWPWDHPYVLGFESPCAGLNATVPAAWLATHTCEEGRLSYSLSFYQRGCCACASLVPSYRSRWSCQLSACGLERHTTHPFHTTPATIPDDPTLTIGSSYVLAIYGSGNSTSTTLISNTADSSSFDEVNS